MLTLAALAKIAKGYALEGTMSDEAFLNALLEPLVLAGRVKARGGKPFELDKSRTSKILNGRCDVPLALRKVLRRYEIEKSTAARFDVFLEEYVDTSFFDPLCDDLLSTVDDEGIRLHLERHRSCPARFMAIALIEAVRNDNRESRRQCVWNSGTGSLSVEVGDLFSRAFGGERKIKQIIVIPVDASFETEVTWGYEGNPAPLISPNTLHGKWLTRMKSAGVDPDELADRIESNFRRRSVSPVRDSKPGRRAEYPLGTVAVIANSRSVFYLLAISRLDDRNNARATREDIASALNRLLEAYDTLGQGLDIFIPLLGTGQSRAGLSHQESLDLMIGEITRSKAKIHGRVTIVVYRGDSGNLIIQ